MNEREKERKKGGKKERTKETKKERSKKNEINGRREEKAWKEISKEKKERKEEENGRKTVAGMKKKGAKLSEACHHQGRGGRNSPRG